MMIVFSVSKGLRSQEEQIGMKNEMTCTNTTNEQSKADIQWVQAV